MDQKSQVELPLDRIDEAALSCAIPGFYGSLSGTIHILPTAALEVTIPLRRVTITQPNVIKDDEAVVPSNERVNKVRQKLSEFREKFRLECPVAEFKMSFRDGHLVTFEVAESVE